MKKRIKENIFKALETIKEHKEHKTATVGTVAALSTVVMSAGVYAAEDAASFSIADNVTTAMLNQILTQMTDLIPIVLPVVVACLAFRKGISFLKGQLMSA